jgi:phage/plasmid-like protein (TIGR03299 family)
MIDLPAEVDSMMYYGTKPWHGLGTSVDHALTADEALVAAGLDWQVELAPLYYMPQHDLLKQVSDKRGVMRMDTKEVMGVVGTKYVPLQNKTAFNFFDEVVGNKKGKYVTAGSLKGGRRVWILAKVGETFRIADSTDEVDRYVLLFNAHDGTSQVKMMITPIRVVCNNTLSAALWRGDAGDDKMVKLRHTSGIIDAAKEVKDVLGIINTYYELFAEEASKMAKVFLSTTDFQSYLADCGFRIIEPKDAEDEKNNIRIAKVREKLEEVFDNGMGMDTNQHSLWNAYNSITEYVDHHRTSRKTTGYGSANEARLDSLWFGEGAKVKRQAWDAALQLI